ncbi:MAG: permease [Xanthomonadales bacterium]|nr:permease [Xanthomonadales bacterium]
MEDFLRLYGEAAKTAVGFFWKAGWAFIMGYAISAMIQAFVPRQRMTAHMGSFGFQPIALSTIFGAISSSCSFAALAAARSLVAKGAHWIAGVAFMFASTNLVIELGILILIFLGWQYLVAELIGGLLLITISAVLMRLFYPRRWLEEARESVEHDAPEEEDFSPMQRMRSREGWRLVGHHFVSEWKMVWQEVLIGFTIAGFMKVFVPAEFWQTIFLMNLQGQIPDVLIALENAVVGPFVAALTFIGSMGNIPLATVLAGSGVAFAGIMAFIYSDLMVPPLVKVNAKYYGWPVALYIAGIMFVSIVITALVLHFGFLALGITPEATAGDAAHDQFAVDYTLFLNVAFAVVAAGLVWLHHRHKQAVGLSGGHGARTFQDYVTWVCIGVLATGVVTYLLK